MPNGKRKINVKRAEKGAKAKASKLAATKGAGRRQIDKKVAATAEALAATYCGLPGAIPVAGSDSLSVVNTASVRIKVPVTVQVLGAQQGPIVAQPWIQVNPGFFSLGGSFADGTASSGLLPSTAFVQQIYYSADAGAAAGYYVDPLITEQQLENFLASLAAEADAFRVAGCSVELQPTDNQLFRSGQWCCKLSSTQRSPSQIDIGEPGSWPEDPNYVGNDALNGFSVGGLMPFIPDLSGPMGTGNPIAEYNQIQANANFDAVAAVSVPVANDQAGFSMIIPPNFSVHDLYPTGGSDQAIPATDLVLMAEAWPTFNLFGDSFLTSAIESGVFALPAEGSVTTVTVANLWVNVAVEYIAQPSSLASYTVIERPIPRAVTDEIVEGVQALRYTAGGSGLVVRGALDQLSKRVTTALMDTAKSVLPKAASLLPKVARSLADKFLPGASDMISAGGKMIEALF